MKNENFGYGSVSTWGSRHGRAFHRATSDKAHLQPFGTSKMAQSLMAAR